MNRLEELAASRRDWIETVLKPWCRAAPLRELIKAEQDWGDLAGRVDPQGTLWTWAWSRFPFLVHEGLSGVDETYQVRVLLSNGKQVVGYPDNRQTQRGRLVLVSPSPRDSKTGSDPAPISIDDIASVERV